MIFRHLPVTFGVMLALTGTAGFLRAIGGDPRPVAVELSATDRYFVTRAAQAGDAEIALVKLAQVKSQNARVKSLAALIQRDHESANARLQTLAEKKRVRLPALSVAQQAAHDRLAALSGAAFDQAWAAQAVKDHNEAIALSTQTTKSSDADLRAFAETKLRALRAHLKDLHSLMGQ